MSTSTDTTRGDNDSRGNDAARGTRDTRGDDATPGTRASRGTGTTRVWRPPVGGTTVHLVGDLHNEVPSVAGHTRTEAVRHDMLRLPAAVTGVSVRVQIGDAIHSGLAGQADSQIPIAQNLFGVFAAADSAPLVYAVGNHETNWGGSGDQMALTLGGRPERNYVTDVGPLRFVVYSPADNAETGVPWDGPPTNWVVPADVLAWLDEQLGATTRPVVLVSHCPPYEAYADDTVGYFLTPVDAITALVARHGNVVAWMSGHRHRWYHDPNLFKAVRYGDHTVALIQAGTCGGTIDPDVRPVGHPVDAVRTNGSVFCTYFGADDPGGHRWECRVRDHSIGCWGTLSTNYRYLWTIPLEGTA